MAAKPFATLSLRARLLLVATLVLLVFLGLTGLVLDQAFRRSAEEGVSERLLLHIYGLLAVTEQVDGELIMPDALQEPDFNRLGTGLYAMVTDASGDELWRSPSALDLMLPDSARARLFSGAVTGDPRFGRVRADPELFFLSYRVLWQGVGEDTTPYTFVVLQTLDTYRSEVTGFRNNLWGWLAAVVVVLILVQALVMRWGLSPLVRLADDLKQIEDGERDYLEGRYPSEIEGVTRNLNLLLASERERRERYRTTLADLAHSLKTPLAILKGAAASLSYSDQESGGVKQTVEDQVDRMNEIVGYQLERAVATSSDLIRKSIDVVAVIERLVAAMRQVYGGKGATITLTSEPCSFFGDERDLMEVAGNIIDNACKHGGHAVAVDVRRKNGRLVLAVDDDGQGIPAEQRADVLGRGSRLDSRAPGQGIGLAVVSEIAARYGGEVAIEDSGLGGARVVVSLP